MLAAVTGASGHLGGNLVRALLSQGRQVRVLVRGNTDPLDHLPLQRVTGDVLRSDSLDQLTRGVHTLFHLAARISITGAEGGLVEAVNVTGTRNIIEACRRGGVRQLIHCSSIHALVDEPRDVVVDESTPLASADSYPAYDRTKALGQQLVMQAAGNGLETVVVNPTAIIGPHDHAPSRMGRTLIDLCEGRLPMLVRGGYDWVDARDVAEAALAAESRGRNGESYILGGHWMDLPRIARVVAEERGCETRRPVAPLWLASLVSPLALLGALATGRPARFTPEAIHALRTHRYVCSDKARREIGHQPRPFRDTIRDTLNWFDSQGMLGAKSQR